MEAVILARHGESVFSARQLVNGDIGVAGPLTPRGEDEARALGRAIAADPIDLCVTSEFERTRQTADVALAGRDVARLVVAELDDPRYGSFEGGSLEEYRTWAFGAKSSDAVPGGGESRWQIVDRYVRGFRRVLDRAEETVLVVIHSLPIAYVLAAQAGDAPAPRVPLVEHAHPYRFAAAELAQAVKVLEEWCAAPTW
jgi:broad specificity phosphatase PhoE